MLLLPAIAHFALDVAAPNEFAVAFLLDVPYSRLVAPAAAQQPTPVDAVRGAIAEATFRSQDLQAAFATKYLLPARYTSDVYLLVVPLAVVGRVLQVDHVRLDEFLEVRVSSPQLGRAAVALDQLKSTQ